MRPEPVAHRNAIWRFIEETADWVEQCLEIGAILSERSGPERPIELGVLLAVVQREAERVLLRLIEIHFFAANGIGEKIQAEDAIPNQIVFLAPSPGLVEGEAGVIAIIGFFDPAFRKFMG